MTKRSFAIVGGVVCVALVAVAAWYRWDWLVAQPDGRESASTTIRNLFIVAGVPAGIWLTWWRLRVADRQAATAQHSLQVANRQAATAQLSLQNDRYQKGAEMLGSRVLSVRLGGIYALRNLADEHPEQYHVDAMRLFCAFVRDPPEDKTLPHRADGSARKKMAATDNDQQLAKSLRPRPDVETIVEMISDRSQARIALEKKETGFQLDLRDAHHLQLARFEGADLSNAALDFADLTNANLKEANLSAASLGGTILKDARNLTQTQLDQAGGYDDHPPKLDGAYDAETDKLLVWNPRPMEGD